MRLFNKLFEPVTDDTEYTLSVNSEDCGSVELPDVQLDEVNVNTIVEDIYSGNGLTDMTCSIFKVENVINSLPKEMPKSTKQATVSQLLNSFGLTIESVCLDGQSRLDILEAAKEKMNLDSSAVIKQKEQEIEEHKEVIAILEKEIADENDTINNSNTRIAEEIERVQKLVEFILPGGVS